MFALFYNDVYGASVEPCLSAQSVDITKLPNDIILPYDCQCTYTDLVCANLKIYDPSTIVTNMPNLSVIFTQSTNPVNYVLPKYRYLILGYLLVPNLFTGVKFVDPNNLTAQLDQNIFINFLEISNFPRDLMFPIGNLQDIDKSQWPKLNIIITNEVTMPLYLESNSFANLKIERMSLQFIGIPQVLKSNSLEGSQVNVLEIKKSSGFTGFEPLPFGSRVTQVNTLIIDTCPNFNLTSQSIPLFDGLTSLTIKSSNIRDWPQTIWENQLKLENIDFSSNVIDRLDPFSFQSLEDRLVNLDLSSNTLTNLNWAAFDDLNKLKTLDLSNSQMTSINSWPKSAQLEKVTLLGYNNTYFGDNYICLFNAFDEMKRTNLSTTLLEFDQNFDCDCFLYYVYRNYRLSPTNLEIMRKSKIPTCYLSLLDNPSGIQMEETKCNFNQILNNVCPKPTTFTSSSTTPSTTSSTISSTSSSISTITTTTTTFTISSVTTTSSISTTTTLQPDTTTTTASSTTSSPPLSPSSTIQTKTGDFITTTCYTESTQPGLTTITIGNLTTITSKPYTVTTPSMIPTQSNQTIFTSASNTNSTRTNSTSDQFTSYSTSAANNNKPPCDEDNQLSTASIIVIVVLGIVAFLLLILIIGLIVYFRNRMRSNMMVPTIHSRNHQIPTN